MCFFVADWFLVLIYRTSLRCIFNSVTFACVNNSFTINFTKKKENGLEQNEFKSASFSRIAVNRAQAQKPKI